VESEAERGTGKLKKHVTTDVYINKHGINYDMDTDINAWRET